MKRNYFFQNVKLGFYYPDNDINNTSIWGVVYESEPKLITEQEAVDYLFNSDYKYRKEGSFLDYYPDKDELKTILTNSSEIQFSYEENQKEANYCLIKAKNQPCN